MASINSPAARTHKLTVEDCISLDTAMLRKEGMLLDFMDHRIQRHWKLDGTLVGELFLTVTFTGEIAYPNLRIDGTCFGRPVVQTVRLASKPMRFGGTRWYFACPSNNRLCCKLILPPGAASFASVKGWDLAYSSQAEDVATRAQRACRKLKQRLQALPPRARHRTLRNLAERIDAKEAFLERVTGMCGLDIANGRRPSVRRAVKSVLSAD